jgi:hypothetical protein
MQAFMLSAIPAFRPCRYNEKGQAKKDLARLLALIHFNSVGSCLGDFSPEIPISR